MILEEYINRLTKIKEQYGGDIELAKRSTSFETFNEIVPMRSMNEKVCNVKTTTKTFKDSFDGLHFDMEVYELNEDGNKKVLIL